MVDEHANDVATISHIPDARAQLAPTLLVIAAGTSRTLALPAEGRVTVGRGADADLTFDDDAISRSHAALTTRDGTITVTDLGSHNGTLVNGDRLVGARGLARGDVVQLGDVVLVAYGRPAVRLADPRVEPALLARLDIELERAAAFDRELAVISIDLANVTPRDATPLVGIATALATALRPIDLVGILGARIVVVAPELDADAALAFAAARVLPVLPTGARAGLATAPDDGADADALVHLATAATAGATTTATIACARANVTELRVGDRVTLVADPAMHRLFELVRNVARSDLAVLVRGDTGTGKEHIARALHAFGTRGAAPFVALNCAAVQDALVESELFGHDRGAFTGAIAAKPGLLEAATGGTIFFDEVGELSLAMQAKLLRALDSKRITRVGSVVERAIDLRVVAATHRDLEAEVAAGRFRRDLYFRIAGATIALPPLRDRTCELAYLAHAFLAEAAARLGRPILRPTTGALRALTAHAWPGNIRELRNAIEYAVATAGEDATAILAAHLPPSVVGSVQTDDDHDIAGAAHAFRPINEEVRDLERRRMREAIAAANGVLKEAARLLAMPLRTFHLKAKQYGLTARHELTAAVDRRS